MSNKYKLIATDFDGTLLTDERKVTKRNKDVLMKYKNKGYITVGVTGRTLGGVMSDIDINLFNYLILNNGCCIYNIKTKKTEYQISFPKNIVEDITNYVENLVYQIDYCTLNTYYRYKNKKNPPVNHIVNINNLDEVEEEITKINLLFMDDNNMEKICSDINEKYNVNAFIMQDSNSPTRILIINPKGINKKETLKILGEKINISKEEMIYFGDGLNDLEIINWVGCGVAMENAFTEVKEKASFVTKSNNEDGVAVFLEKVLK